MVYYVVQHWGSRESDSWDFLAGYWFSRRPQTSDLVSHVASNPSSSTSQFWEDRCAAPCPAYAVLGGGSQSSTTLANILQLSYITGSFRKYS